MSVYTKKGTNFREKKIDLIIAEPKIRFFLMEIAQLEKKNFFQNMWIFLHN